MRRRDMEPLAEYLDEEGFLSVRVLAPWTADHAKGIIDQAKKEAVAKGYNRIFVDVTNWTKPDTELTRFLSGEYLAGQLGRPFRVVALANAEGINRFAENTAVNRGADFRVFSDRPSAMEWLLRGTG